MSSSSNHIHIGGLIFSGMNQADFTGPFEILANVPDSTFHVIGKDKSPVRDARGLVFTPQLALSETPHLDVLLVPGGGGVNALMEDETILSFVREQSARAKIIFTVCTGSFVLGAAGLLKGRRATTHWASHHLLKFFGAIPVNERVVVDGNLVTAAGVTSGIDGALRVVAMLRGERAAQAIQLYVQYAPEPPFHSGTPETAPPELLRNVRSDMQNILDARLAIAQRVAAKLGVSAR